MNRSFVPDLSADRLNRFTNPVWMIHSQIRSERITDSLNREPIRYEAKTDECELMDRKVIFDSGKVTNKT